MIGDGVCVSASAVERLLPKRPPESVLLVFERLLPKRPPERHSFPEGSDGMADWPAHMRDISCRF